MSHKTADPVFDHPRLASIYDALDGPRRDLEVYAAIVDELGARRVLDIGCGTGTFALMLAAKGLEATGVDPAAASLQVAQAKPGAEQVHWIHGDATDVTVTGFDLATMTANVAQAIADPADWTASLRAAHAALRPGGWLVFESRRRSARAWEQWNRQQSYAKTNIPGVGMVEHWVELTDVSLPLVSFRWTWVFASDGQILTSDSRLRFREEDEIRQSLLDCGYKVKEVREAPDRPGLEMVFLARR